MHSLASVEDERAGYLAASFIECTMLPLHTDQNKGEWAWIISCGDLFGTLHRLPGSLISMEFLGIPTVRMWTAVCRALAELHAIH
eukprot:5343924-Amphidinium_carterae.2